MGHDLKTALDGTIGGTSFVSVMAGVEHALPEFMLWGGAALVLIRLCISLRELFNKNGRDKDAD